MGAKLKKNDVYFDLGEFDPFLKIDTNDIASLPKRSASYTVDFEIPWTSRNNALLENIGETNLNGSGDPNKRINDIFLEFETVTYQGFLRIVDSKPNRYYTVAFFTDVSDWVDLMKGRKMYQLNLDDLDHNYNINNIADSFSNTDGYIYPFINYGYWNQALTNFLGNAKTQANTSYENYYPAVYDKRLLKQCFKDIGWNLDPNSTLLKEPRFQRQVTPFSEGQFNITEEIISPTRIELFFFGSESLGAANVPVDPTGVVDLNGLYDTVTNLYTVPEDGRYVLKNLEAASPRGASTLTVTVGYRLNGVYTEIGDTSEVTGITSFGNVSLVLSKGDEIGLEFRAENFTNGTLLSYKANIERDSRIFYDDLLDVAGTLPTVDQIDFVKDIIVQYGVFLTTDIRTQTVKFDLYKDIDSKKGNSVDWTDKIDASEPVDVNYKTIVDNYYKVNDFIYQQNTDEESLNELKQPLTIYNNINKDVNLGNGQILVDNDFLKLRGAIYESKFGSVIEDSFAEEAEPNGQRIAYIPYVDIKLDSTDPNVIIISDTENTMSTPRKGLIINDVPVESISNGIWTDILIFDKAKDITGGVFVSASEVPYFYFVKDVKSDEDVNAINYNLSYNTLTDFNNDNGLLKDYYETQIDIIQRGQTVMLKLRLSESDLLGLDFTQPFILNTPEISGYFIINKIPKLNSTTESIMCELIKLP